MNVFSCLLNAADNKRMSISLCRLLCGITAQLLAFVHYLNVIDDILCIPEMIYYTIEPNGHDVTIPPCQLYLILHLFTELHL